MSKSVDIGIAPSAAMWRLLPPWLIFNNGSIVSFWPCIPGSHRYTLGLRTSMCTLVKQPPTTEVADCHHDRSTQLWLTALSFSIIFSIFLASLLSLKYHFPRPCSASCPSIASSSVDPTSQISTCLSFCEECIVSCILTCSFDYDPFI